MLDEHITTSTYIFLLLFIYLHLQHLVTSSCRSSSTYILQRGVGGKPKILAKRDPSFSNCTWESIFRMNVHFCLLPENWVAWICRKIWRDTVTWTHRLLKEGNYQERRLYYACWGSYPRFIRGRERADQKSATRGQIVQAISHHRTLITSTSAREVARTSARRLGHPARAGFLYCLFFSLSRTPRYGM